MLYIISTMLYMICYDVVSSRRRRKIANLLLDHGTRVQKSAFECDLNTDARLRDLLLRVRTEVDPKTDTVRVYRVCASCRTEMKAIGVNHARAVEKTIII